MKNKHYDNEMQFTDMGHARHHYLNDTVNCIAEEHQEEWLKECSVNRKEYYEKMFGHTIIMRRFNGDRTYRISDTK